MISQRDVTTLLEAHANGDEAALAELLPYVYGELRRIAAARLRREAPGHTLSPTEVVHEAFLELVPLERLRLVHRAHFLAVASRAMRNVLVDHAIRRKAVKRGGGAVSSTLHDGLPQEELPVDDLIALGDALARLERIEPRQAAVVECRFFGDLSLDETAEALGLSAATVSRDWAFARAWLERELGPDPGA